MVNIAIFASGNGSNFENIIQEINNGHVNNAVCKVLIIDKEHAYAKERAEKLHIPCVYVNPKAYAGKEPYEQKILSILKEHQVELIVLAGYMRFIGKVLLESFPRRIINLHPAYLPNFPGAHSIQDAYEAKVDFTGVTVHFVDEGTDTGPIILQKAVEVEQDDTPEMLQRRVMEQAEWKILPEAIHLIANGKVHVENGHALIKNL